MIERKFITQIRVRYSETDQMGYCYYGNYAQFLEIGRVEALRNSGFRYKEMEQQGILLPVLDFQIKYIFPAKYDDLLTIERYNEIKNTTDKVTPTIYDNSNKCEIIVYYTINKKPQQKSFKYKQCGIEIAMKKTNEHIDKLREEHTNIFSNQVIRKC